MHRTERSEYWCKILPFDARTSVGGTTEQHNTIIDYTDLAID